MRAARTYSLWLSFSLLLGMVIHIGSASAAKAQLTRKLPLPAKPCQTKSDSTWTPQEQWVWKQICRGK